MRISNHEPPLQFDYALEADIGKLDGEIDERVYELYGLTDDEIAIVEGRNK